MKTQLKINAVNCFATLIGRLARMPERLRILTFHDISDDAADVYAVTKGQFADYLSLLRDEGYTTIRARDLLSDWPSVLSQDRVVLLTFDDAFATQRDIAAELLTQHDMTATFFVISSLVGQNRTRYKFGGKERTFLCKEDLRQMVLDGFDIGSHSHTHTMFGTLTAEQVDDEARLSKQILKDATGRDVIGFAYPFGRQRAFSSITKFVLEKNGYSIAFTQEGVGVKPTSDLLTLPRINVDRLDTIGSFRRKLLGQYELISKIRSYAK